jgi:LuxR family maltose regulon positive regulatory protein
MTKLYTPPPKPDLVPRSCLVERLNVGLHRAPDVPLASGSAGFGKTMLVSEAVRPRLAFCFL